MRRKRKKKINNSGECENVDAGGLSSRGRGLGRNRELVGTVELGGTGGLVGTAELVGAGGRPAKLLRLHGILNFQGKLHLKFFLVKPTPITLINQFLCRKGPL